MKHKILCIDDIPNEPIGGNQRELTLEKCLEKMYSDKYDVKVEPDPEEAIRLVKTDLSIKLIFLDVIFKDKVLGPLIAEQIEDINKDIPIIVLTKEPYHGGKGGRDLVYMDNIWKYIEKEKFADPAFQQKIINLTETLIVDPLNNHWLLETDFDYEKMDGHIKLRNLRTGFETKYFKIPQKIRDITLYLFEYLIDMEPRKPFQISSIPHDLIEEIERKYEKGQASVELKDIRSILNNKIMEVTGWRTWGILDKKGCETGEIMLMVETNLEVLTSQTPTTDPSNGAFKALHQEVADLRTRLEKVEQFLKMNPK